MVMTTIITSYNTKIIEIVTLNTLVLKEDRDTSWNLIDNRHFQGVCSILYQHDLEHIDSEGKWYILKLDILIEQMQELYNNMNECYTEVDVSKNKDFLQMIYKEYTYRTAHSVPKVYTFIQRVITPILEQMFLPDNTGVLLFNEFFNNILTTHETILEYLDDSLYNSKPIDEIKHYIINTLFSLDEQMVNICNKFGMTNFEDLFPL